MVTSVVKVPDGEGESPDASGDAYAPPRSASAEDAAALGRWQGSAAVVCVPISTVVLVATIGVTRATQSRGMGFLGFAVAALVGLAGAGLGMSSLVKGEIARGRSQGFSTGVFLAAFLNGLLAVGGGFLIYVLLVVPED